MGASHPPPTTVLIRNRASREGSQQLMPANVPRLLGPGPLCPRKGGGRGPPHRGQFPGLCGRRHRMSLGQSFSGSKQTLFLGVRGRGHMGSPRGDCPLTFGSGHLQEAKEAGRQALVLANTAVIQILKGSTFGN